MKKHPVPRAAALCLLAACVFLSCLAAPAMAQETAQVPVPGQVTMLDLGAKKCVPCRMMTPILAELETAYAGRAAIVFIDVWENPEVARQYGLGAIPTQIFYDAKGVEQFRHEGFFDKPAIEAVLKRLGVQ